jgi:hypothetical protein
MPVNYKLTFWDVQAGTSDVGAPVRAQVAKATLALQDHPDVLFASSAGGYDDTETLEIALLVAADYELLKLQPYIERNIRAEGLTSKVYPKSHVRFYNLGSATLEIIKKATYITDVDTVRTQLDSLVDLPRVAPTPAANRKTYAELVAAYLSAAQAKANAADTQDAEGPILAADFSTSDLLEEISVTEDKCKRMKAARDDDIETEVQEINAGLQELASITDTNTAVFEMIKSEIISVGKKMWNAYGGVGKAGGLSALLSGIISSIGGAPEVAISASVAAAVLTILWVLFKP